MAGAPASQLGVDETSIFNREANTSQPALRYMPAVIEFLGYNPLPAPTTIGERIVRRRTALGMSQKDAACTLGVDPTTLARWERGEREPTGEFAETVNFFLAGDGDRERLSAKIG